MKERETEREVVWWRRFVRIEEGEMKLKRRERVLRVRDTPREMVTLANSAIKERAKVPEPMRMWNGR